MGRTLYYLPTKLPNKNQPFVVGKYYIIMYTIDGSNG